MSRDTKKNTDKKCVLKTMFDLRPMTRAGVLDMEKINQAGAVLDLRKIVISAPKNRLVAQDLPQSQFKNQASKSSLRSKPQLKPKFKSQLEYQSQTEDQFYFEENLAKPEEIKSEIEEIGGIEINHDLPTREEILAELSKIDEEEQLLVELVSKNEPIVNDQPLLYQEEIEIEEEKPDLTKSYLNLDDVDYFTQWKDQNLKKSQVEIASFVDSKASAKRAVRKRKKIKLEKKSSVVLGAPVATEAIKAAEVKETPLSRAKPFLSRGLIGFLVVGFLVALVVPALAWVREGWSRKGKIAVSSLAAYENLLSAQRSLEETNWQAVEQNFSLAHENFFKANEEIKKLGKLTINLLERIPGGSLVASGAHLVRVGENLALAGQNLSAAINLFTSEDLFSLFDLEGDKSLSSLVALNQEKLNLAFGAVSLAKKELEQVKIDVLPPEFQDNVSSLKENLPLVENLLGQSVDYSTALLDILGHNNPRQYLLLFQNNSEIRASGGFIGTYGLLSLDRGRVENLFIDGVFNADGQLHEKIIPPRPIQKISTAWSMHDANWFADFPLSAQKVAWFYEKTGGPTVDGVIGLTPVVIERLLELVGPIEMPEYDVILTPENFVELIQYKVEVDYDRELNRPKKILADFAPKFIQRITQLPLEKRKEVMAVILNAFQEKHILIYFHRQDLEELVRKQGWTGELLGTEKDYLSVVSSNINGFKTDRVIQEEISHRAEIQPDGSIIDNLTIIRRHQGGDLDYDWWNRVNANYLRVYLPRGSELLSAEGQTLEIYLPPIDYGQRGFKEDFLVKQIEDGMIIDKKTGTQIFEESGKTVFGNWVYVSPGESVQLTYRYKLPFKIDLTKSADSYSLLVQKQAGSLGSQFIHNLEFPESWQTSWQYPENWALDKESNKWSGDLKIDRFLGMIFKF